MANLPTGPEDARSTVCHPGKRQSSSPFASIPCCRWTTVSMPPTSDAVFAASLLATPWQLTAAAGRRRNVSKAELQGLSNRLFPRRHRRNPASTGQALSWQSTSSPRSPSSNCTKRSCDGAPPPFSAISVAAAPTRPHYPHRQSQLSHHTSNTGSAPPDISDRSRRTRLGVRIRIRLRSIHGQRPGRMDEPKPEGSSSANPWRNGTDSTSTRSN